MLSPQSVGGAVGLWSWLVGTPGSSSATPPVLAAPHSGDSLEAAIVGDIFGALPAEIVTEDVARRVAELKRAVTAHQALVAPLRFEVYRNDERAKAQPFWVSQCSYPAMSRHLAKKMLVSELFWHGFGVLACWLDTDGNVYDWITVPRSKWSLDRSTGKVTLSTDIPPQFQMRVVLVPLGNAGVMVDAVDAIRQARMLDAARRNRLDSPPAATELHITDAQRDEMTAREREKLAKEYATNRAKYSVAVTPSYLDVKERGISGSLDLFETAKNSLRLELAMHGGVPAAFVNGGREGGSSGEMTYTNANGETSELWTFGSAEYAWAVAAALSGDDVVGADAEVRFDTTPLAVPAPTVQDPEAGDPAATPEQ